MAKFATVEEYLAALAEPLREIWDKVRPVIDAALPGVNMALWYGQPTWGMGSAPGKSPVVFIRAYSSYLTMGVWRGKEISDSSGRLEVAARGVGNVKLRSVADIDAELFTDWLSQALELERAEQKG
ncbi:DUF1801 domain-containing protein [Streptosporangium sp. NPDC000396]|uniref:DUF1801 domain-containing protein n=1 Tax=Streptosporangium sp. NPDC000396 TaxID=3366185 RepID=UPI00367F7201